MNADENKRKSKPQPVLRLSTAELTVAEAKPLTVTELEANAEANETNETAETEKGNATKS